MRSARQLVFVWLAVCAAVACKDDSPSGPNVGTNSNWLRACVQVEECGDLPACECGACTIACTTDDDCRALGDARCAAAGTDLAAQAACAAQPTAPQAGICLPRCAPGGCVDGQACVAEACVLAPIPDVPFCDPVATQPAALRAREEQLLALLQELRMQGGTVCETGAAPAPPAPALIFDPRLSCAARVWAAELAQTGTPSATDAEGRTGEDRQRAAGVAPVLWGDSFALEADDAAEALALMLGDPGSCARLVDPAYMEVGVGGAGNALVATLAAQ